MKGERRRRMRRDCARLMAGAIVATCLECLLGMAAPTVVSLLLGDMADALLALDVAAIGAQFPAFLGGILVTVLVAPGMTLVKNLLLTRQGTAYDMFLMESTLGLPHKSLHQVDAGDYLHRFEVDRTLYYCCVVRLLGCPPAMVAYGVLFAWMVERQGYPWGYCLWVLVLSGASVAYDAARARRKAEWNKETADYEGQRTQLELELLALRDVSHGFGLHPFLLDRMRCWFDRYWKRTGQRQCTQTAMSQTLQGFWDYGVQVACILVGAVLVARDQMTLGGLLGGYLLLPTVKQFWVSVRQLVEDVQSERTYGARMEYFYQEREEEPDEGTMQPLEILALHNVGFSYAAEDMPVFPHQLDPVHRGQGPADGGKRVRKVHSDVPSGRHLSARSGRNFGREGSGGIAPAAAPQCGIARTGQRHFHGDRVGQSVLTGAQAGSCCSALGRPGRCQALGICHCGRWKESVPRGAEEDIAHPGSSERGPLSPPGRAAEPSGLCGPGGAGGQTGGAAGGPLTDFP